ncbi:hypothetical protein TRIUR3_28122 [Triticum urartu]|uniref:HMA domain-containing protein n=2 Tax=Triticum TaxID=4564 RepID=A0A9R0VKA8_TRITD|nr:hypothetical protein TRIUR3_28122 [Triticum urartu]VAH59594.1 unnamed protein product [Triticum turgidum subsp. durum]
MSKKIVIRADLVGKKCTSGILSIVSKLEGIKSMVVDDDKCTLTVVGTVDPVCVVHQLRKSCYAASIVSVEDDKPKEKKTPCQEACEKAWKDKYEKACKERCEKACKEPCCDDCGEKGTPYAGHGLEKCQERLRNLRKKVREWNKNADAWYRKIKIEIIGKLDVIDKNTDVMGLTIGDR